jgi:hypothetical protein
MIKDQKGAPREADPIVEHIQLKKQVDYSYAV